MLVEDDLSLAGFLRDYLCQSGYVVEHAADRPSALQTLRKAQAPLLGLLDLGLPPHASSMSEGLALLDAWLLCQPAAKILVLTGQDESSAASEAVRRGAFDFLVKPIALPILIQAVRRAALFLSEEQRMVAGGEARLQITTRTSEGPKQAASAAEEQLLRRTLAETSFNIAETARRLGATRENIYYYLNKYGIRRPD